MRGHKGALLSKNDYASLQQCETLEDIKLFLVRNSECICNAVISSVLSTPALALQGP